jgi:glycosyltransferase involved in cell wall biosynthesis
MRITLSFGAWAASGLSGGDRHLLESAARWRSEVDIAAVAPEGARETIASFLGDIPFRSRGASARLSTIGPLLAAEYVRRALVAELATRPTDVAVAASHFLPDAAFVHAAARRGAHGVAFVYHLVAGRSDRSLRTRWSRVDEAAGLRLLRTSAETVFSSNDETLEQLRGRGFAPLRTDVGLDVGAFRRAAPDNAPPTILFVARLVPKKGLLDLVAALPEIRRRVPDARVVVAGAGPDLEAGRERARALGVADAIAWLGFVSEEEKRELLATSRVFAAPSYEEGWGISVAEAMASGLPVVAYELATLDEVFADAYLPVALGSTDALASAIVRLLENDGAARDLAARGTARVARYDVDAIAEQELRTILARRSA